MNISHYLFVCSTEDTSRKLGNKRDLVEYPEYYQVSVDLLELSGTYKRWQDYENPILFEKRELHNSFKKYNVGASALT